MVKRPPASTEDLLQDWYRRAREAHPEMLLEETRPPLGWLAEEEVPQRCHDRAHSGARWAPVLRSGRYRLGSSHSALR